MSLWDKIKKMWEETGKIDKEEINDLGNDNTKKIENMAKNLKPGEDFEVVDTSTGGFVPKVKGNETKARQAAAKKNKTTTTKVLDGK